MAKTLSQAEKQKHLIELIKGFDNAMLVTRTDDGGLRSRPLAIADVEDSGLLYFATAVESGKAHEVEADPNVNVSLQDARRFVSLTGTARIVQDRALVERFWSEAWKVWFPAGKDDPSLCLLEVDVSAAEYWDRSGGKAIRYLYEAVAAYVRGTRPAPGNDEQNAKVRLSPR